MADRRRVRVSTGLQAEVVFTDVADGDFRVRQPQPELDAWRAKIVDRPWSWIVQVHESTVLDVGHPGQHAGAVADGLVTTSPACPVAVTTADCAPLVLLAEHGVSVVHAGWRGLVAGIVEEAAERLSAVAGSPVGSMLGPCIAPQDYQFGSDDLEAVAERFGPTVRGATTSGDPALDVPAAVMVACERAGWPAPERPPSTSDRRWFSHRTRGDLGRQTAVAWLVADQETR